MAKTSASRLKAISSFTDNKLFNTLDKINKLTFPASVLDNMSKNTSIIVDAGLQQRAILDKLTLPHPALNAEATSAILKIGLQQRAVFDKLAKTATGINSLGNIVKIGKIFEDNRKQMFSTFSSIAKIALANNKFIIPDLVPINKTILSIHKNLANNLSDESWNTLFQNLGNLTADINFSDVKIESQGDTLVINNEVITEASINDLTERLSNTKENVVAVWKAIPKSIKIFFAFLLSIYFSWFANGLLGEIPENSIFHYKFYSNMLFSKPTIIQQKLIKQIKLKPAITPQYIVNRQLMPVYLYANRKGPIVSYLFCGNEVKIIKSIKKKHWLFIEWTCNGEKESGWILGRYILKISSKKYKK